MFSCQGIQLAVDWFFGRGHRDVTVFVPAWRKEQSRPDALITGEGFEHLNMEHPEELCSHFSTLSSCRPGNPAEAGEREDPGFHAVTARAGPPRGLL